MTVLEIIQRSSEFLARKGVDSSRLQIELMLAHVLEMPRLKLYLNFARTLNENELQILRGLVARRAAREPLQHILGSTWFCGLEITVTPEVLVPRPETELLAERAWEFLRKRQAEGQSARVLDFGTGSGCVAIAIAAQVPLAQVLATDISEAALEVARKNALRHQVSERLRFHHGDGFAALPAGAQFDLVVSNPPYIPSAEMERLEPEVRDHEPRVALAAGRDGLDFYRRLALEAPPWLVREGRIMLEFGDGQEDAVRELFSRQPWGVEAVETDYTKRPRILIARRAV